MSGRSARRFAAAAVVFALLAHAGVARADCTEDAGCAFNQYCGLGDGGVAEDASAGSCLPQPCVVASDCTDAGAPLCDTSHPIFQCVECISTADCPGVLVCDPTTRTCIQPPPSEDAGPEGGALEDAASASDASTGADATLPPGHDAGARDGASTAPDSSASNDEDAGATAGTLAGGACDCDVARPNVGPGALGVPALVGLLFGVRRRARRRSR